MRDAHRGLGLVHVLTAGAGRAICVDLQLLGPDLDLGVVLDLGSRVDECERGLPALLEVERRDPHQTVGATLGLEIPVCVRALDGEGRAADARLFAGSRLDDLRLEAAPFGPAQIHPHEHLRPVGSIRSAHARGDRDDGIAFVVRAAELRLEACLVDLSRKLRRIKRRATTKRAAGARGMIDRYASRASSVRPIASRADARPTCPGTESGSAATARL